MTYLEILSWARKGLAAEKTKLREMQEKAIEGHAYDIKKYCQQQIEALEIKETTINEIEDLHNRK